MRSRQGGARGADPPRGTSFEAGEARAEAQLKLAALRFGDAVWHKEHGTGLVLNIESQARGERSVAVYWLDRMVGPPWQRPLRVSECELEHDWDRQAEYPDTWEHASDDEWEA